MSPVEELRATIRAEFPAAMAAAMEEVNDLAIGDVYAVVLRELDGFGFLGLAVNTREHLAEQITGGLWPEPSLHVVPEVAVAEFCLVGIGSTHFNSVVEARNAFFEQLWSDEGASIDDPILLLGSLFTDALAALDTHPPVARNGLPLLRGIQNPDPSANDVAAMLASSNRLNTPDWHGRVEACADAWLRPRLD